MPSTVARRGAVILIALVPLSACADAPPGPRTGPPPASATAADLHRYVTGEAAANLVEGNHFARLAESEPGATGLISAERAGQLALADARTFGPFVKRGWERDRGAAIDLTGLRVHPVIHFARTPYGEFPDGYHPAFRTGYGPYYLVHLVDGAGRTVLVSAVSAFAVDVTVDDHGRLRLPVQHGNEVIVAAIPVDSTRWSPRSPEEAVRLAAGRSGARAVRTPELVLVGRPYHPYWAAWKVTLERPVPVRARSGRQRATDELYVSPNGKLWAPAESQPARVEVVAERAAATVAEARRARQTPDRVWLGVRPGFAIKFEEVDPAGTGE
jgi:hypothetical protein